MVVSDKLKYVFIAVPKTGSQAVCHWLCSNYYGKHALNYHDAEIPAAYTDYLVWTVVREPYARCFSWWWMGCREPSRREKNADTWGQSFKEFMVRNIERKNDWRWRDNPEKPNYSMTQKSFVDRSGAQTVVHYEQWRDELAGLPFIKKLVWPIPSRNTSTKPKRSFHEYFFDDPEAEGLVWEYCAEDFEAFGYERIRA